MSETTREPLRNRLGHVIFETHAGWPQRFDAALLLIIVLSILGVMLESVAAIRAQYGAILHVAEWVFTGLFTIEYAMRVWVARKRWRYLLSFFGLVDLLSIVPSYLGLFFGGMQSLLIIRALRILRVFRVLKIVRMSTEATSLTRALWASAPKIIVFLAAVVISTVIMGSLMYLIEGGANGFTSIPRSVYWAIVTLTTVGYGDIAPQTPLGQFVSAMVMILGYGVIAVPTGIISAELVSARKTRSGCSACGAKDHTPDAAYCRVCGAPLETKPAPSDT